MIIYPRPIRLAALAALLFVPAVFVIGGAAPVLASEIVFQGQNAGLFSGANPSDTSDLMNSTPKPHNVASSTPTINSAAIIEQSLESQISTKIYNDIFTGMAASGFYNLGNGNTITFLRNIGDGTVTITIVSPTSGTTVITVPDV